jgi:propionate CoA-transferase
LGKLALANRIEANNLPLGCIAHLYRSIAARGPGTITKIGLRTFVDPRLEGGKLNERTTEDLVELLTINDEEWLRYKTFPIDVALLRGTTADPAGNITMEREALTLDNLAMAMAAKNSRGFVIVQVERIAATNSLDPRAVQIPGILFDCVVVSDPENHAQTYGTPYSHASRVASGCRWIGSSHSISMSVRSSRGDARSNCRPAASSISASACRKASLR